MNQPIARNPFTGLTISRPIRGQGQVETYYDILSFSNIGEVMDDLLHTSTAKIVPGIFPIYDPMAEIGTTLRKPSHAIIFQQELPNQRRHTQQIVSPPNLHHAFSSVTPYTVATPDSSAFFDAHEARTPSPPTSDRSTPANGKLAENMMNGGFRECFFSCSNGVYLPEVHHKRVIIPVFWNLIFCQDPRSEGLVQLSAEERRTLVQEGYPIPTRLPLSKSEEESLKIVRRKIKNKLSAQESRRKRKEYMDSLESRCQAYFNENSQLKNRVRQLELSNQKLAMQMKKLQNMVNTTEEHSDIPVVH
ncbi:unnamed protein product [Angiostrongylus costaricensis]|uniref:BZIP domain-containing protein n=1 Tax=Angiostrongylus costaricensis TaxID=334426 RepID=A0A0R3PZJ8_ANGCS|nr:unnamed protein product [Angiostrongylus costaricensis]